MTLKTKIEADLKSVLKEKRELEVLTLRLLLAAISNWEIEKRTRIWKVNPETEIEELKKESQITDEEVINVISSEIKKRKEAILEFEKGGRQDLVEKETKEKEILEKYLPEQLSEEEIKRLAKEAIEKLEAKEMKDMGKVMEIITPQVKGRADMGQVSKVVKEFLMQK